MPFITGTLLATLGAFSAQVAASAFNYFRNRDLQEEIQRLQQEFELRLHDENMTFLRREMNRLLTANLEMEEDVLKSRLEISSNSLESELELQAYASSLENWPLIVPPFVMKDSSFSLKDSFLQGNAKVGMHCIIAPSMDTYFDREVLPLLEDKISVFLKKNYSFFTDHPITFYQDAWKNDLEDSSALIKDMYSHTSALPVLIISPRFNQEGGIYFLFSFWGLGKNEKGESSDFFNAKFIPKGISLRFEPMHKYTEEEMVNTIDIIAPVMLCFICFIADNFYWAFDRIAPRLLSLITDGVLEIPEEMKKEYIACYNNIFDSFMELDTNIALYPHTALDLIKSMRKPHFDIMIKELWERMARLRGFQNDLLNPNLYTFSENDKLFLQKMKGMGCPIASDKEIENLLQEIGVDTIIDNIPFTDICY